MIECINLKRRFEQGGRVVHVLKGIDIDIEREKLTILRGRSGSGKTTLLNIMGGLDLPTSGTVIVDNVRIDQLNDAARTKMRRQDMGFIFQSFALLPHLSAWENVELSLRMADVPRNQWKVRIQECLELVGLGKRAKHRPSELSGGEQQRVAIAKAIAHRPKMLLADEPTAELDTNMSKQILRVFHDVLASQKMTICMTTHDPMMMEGADFVYEMVDGILAKQSVSDTIANK